MVRRVCPHRVGRVPNASLVGTNAVAVLKLVGRCIRQRTYGQVFDGFVKRIIPGIKSSWENEESIIATTGWLEHKYDIKLLYGIPQVPTSRSPLNILLSTGYPALFDIKIIQMVVALKWSVFGQRYYVCELGRYLVLTLSFILGFILWGHGTNYVGQAIGDDGHSSLEIIGGTVARVLCWLVTLFNLLVEEGREFRAAKSARL